MRNANFTLQLSLATTGSTTQLSNTLSTLFVYSGPVLTSMTVGATTAIFLNTSGGSLPLVLNGYNFANGSSAYDPVTVFIGE